MALTDAQALCQMANPDWFVPHGLGPIKKVHRLNGKDLTGILSGPRQGRTGCKLRSATQTRAKSSSLCPGSTGEKQAILGQGWANFAHGSAIDACCFDGREKLPVKTRIPRQQCFVAGSGVKRGWRFDHPTMLSKKCSVTGRFRTRVPDGHSPLTCLKWSSSAVLHRQDNPLCWAMGLKRRSTGCHEPVGHQIRSRRPSGSAQGALIWTTQHPRRTC